MIGKTLRKRDLTEETHKIDLFLFFSVNTNTNNMKVYVVVDDGVQGVFRKKSSAVNYMLENILGFHISRTTFLRLVDLGEKKKYKFTAEDIEKYRQMSDKEFDKFITDSMDGSISKLKKVIRQFGDNNYEWTWGFAIETHEVK